MPTVRSARLVTQEGPEPVVVPNPDPPIPPGAGSDVDTHVRVENVGLMVPSIPLEGAVLPPPPPGLAGFVNVLAGEDARSAEPLLSTDGAAGWVEKPVELTGVVREWEPDGDRYVVLCRPWINVRRSDKRFVTGNRGDVVTLLHSQADRLLASGAIVPEELFATV